MSGTEHDRLVALLASLPDEAPPADVQARLRAALAAATSDERSDSAAADDATARAPTAPVRVLLIHEPGGNERSILWLLRKGGMIVEHLGTDTEVAELLARPDAIETWDVIVLDLDLPGVDGLDALRRLRAADPTVSVVALANHRSTPTTHDALHTEAFSYLRKPFYNGVLVDVVLAASRLTAAARHTRDDRLMDLIVGDAPATRTLRGSIALAAPGSASVFLVGERGTDKALVARALHERSGRRGKPFVVMLCRDSDECGALLFGDREAPTPSAIIDADGGTLFLEDVDLIPRDAQLRLFQALRTRELDPLAGEERRGFDVRVVASCHSSSPASAVARGDLLEELYDDLRSHYIRIPPLRERLDDIPALISRIFRLNGRRAPMLSPEALEALRGYRWMMNDVEFDSCMWGSIQNIPEDGIIELMSLPAQVIGGLVSKHLEPAPLAGRELPDLRQASEDAERRYCQRLLREANGSLTVASRLGGIDRPTLRKIFERYGLKPERP